MTKHQWREEVDGIVRFWRANYHGGRFTFYTQTDAEEKWTSLDPPDQEVLEAFRDVLWRKYQRKRCSYKLVAKIDKMLGRSDDGAR